ncbi:MAG: site-specific DNA-methyltransferase [archaeon]|nr:site-specific DNA-methyltransferase [archaeon]
MGGKLLTTNTETNGRFHSNWLNMMYPRLKLARNLLKDDAVLVINIDDNEIKNLLTLCQEVFGEENVDCGIWQKVDNDSGKMKITYRMRLEHEYVVFCFKNKNHSFFNKFIEERNYKNEYTNPDNDPRGPWISALISNTEENSNPNGELFYDIETPSGKIISRQWRVAQWEMEELIKDNRIYFGSSGDSAPRLKSFINEPKLSTPTTIFNNVGTAKTAGKMIEEIMGDRKIFSYPKPVEFVEHLLKIITDCRYSLNPNKSSRRKIYFPGANMDVKLEDRNEIILDFFSGSATTAHAVMDLNNQDNLNRKFIMVQLPELLDEKSKFFNEEYKNVCEIGKDRIRKAGDKIVEESGNKNLDIGFKVFKLDSSNLEKWDPDYNDLEQTLLMSQDNIKSDRTQEDLVYEIMLKYGIDLALPVEKHELSDNTIYSIGFGALLICLDDNITKDISNSIIELSKDSDICRVVFKDNGFASDSDKTNIKENLRTHNIDEFITI